MKRVIAKAEWGRIIVYGTGIISRDFLLNRDNEDVKFVADSSKLSGCFCGINIRPFWEIEPGTADTVLIAASPSNYESIYKKIYLRCFRNHWKIIDKYGNDLTLVYGFDIRSNTDNDYLGLNIDLLKSEIDNHKAISFDLFDTLIVRKTLFSTDIFKLVENRLRDRGINCNGFFNKRIDAEHKCEFGNIYDIYDILKNDYEWDDSIRDIALTEEIQCERLCIVPRATIKDVFEYAKHAGKTVSIISDMYFTGDVLESLLDYVGINGYDRIFVSCDEKSSKQDGTLFHKYMEAIGETDCLHIGDNDISDYSEAQKAGLDAFLIKSPYDMLAMSSLKNLLGAHNNLNDRMLLGIIVSELFNDPFALSSTCCVPIISSWNQFSTIILFPVLIHFVSGIINELYKNEYDGVLFASRDCYIVKKVVERLVLSETQKAILIYYYTSRKTGIKMLLQSKKDISLLDCYFSLCDDYRDVLKHYLSFKDDEIRDGGFQSNADSIISKANRTIQNVQKYFNNHGIDAGKKYLFCDFIAQGTSQFALEKMGFNKIEGFYYALFHGDHNYNLRINSIYSEDIVELNGIYKKDPLLEELFSSPEPSVIDFDDQGVPIFDEEVRDRDYLLNVSDIQDRVVELAVNYFNEFYVNDEKINDTIPEMVLRYSDILSYSGECEKVYDYYCENNYDFPWFKK